MRQSDVGVTDVLRGERQQDARQSAVGALAGKQVEQEEERRLAAAGQSDVAGRDRPAELIPQRLRHRLAKPEIAFWCGISRDEPTELGGVRRDFHEPPPVDGFYRSDARGIAATEHVDVGFARTRHGGAQVRHEFERARGPRHALAEPRTERPHVDSSPA
jgi:hypothetical protein